MRDEVLLDGFASFPEHLQGSFQVDGVPQDDGGHHQVESAGPVVLILKAPIPHFSQAVEEHGAGQRATGFTLFHPSSHAAAQFYALPPVLDKQRALDALQLT